jgi:hypothetical protein
MEHRMVSRRYAFWVAIFLLLAACSPAPVPVPTTISTTLPPAPVLVLTQAATNTSLPPAASATPVATLLESPTLKPLPPMVLAPLPDGAQWPVQDSQSLKQQIKDAQVIVIRMEGFRYCPSSYNHDFQPTTEQKTCTDLEFELGGQQRQQLIEAIDDKTQAMRQMPESLYGGGSPIIGLPFPKFRVSLILSKFRLDLEWATDRSFFVNQYYYPNRSRNMWDFMGEFSQGQGEFIAFVQEQPLLYQAVKEILPAIVFPPEYPAYVLAYERVVVSYGEKKCAYNNASFPSFTDFIQDILNRSIPVDEVRPADKPRATFDFLVREQVYPLSIWDEGKFSYQEKIYRYTPLTVAGYTEPSLSQKLGDVLDALSAFTECKAP